MQPAGAGSSADAADGPLSQGSDEDSSRDAGFDQEEEEEEVEEEEWETEGDEEEEEEDIVEGWGASSSGAKNEVGDRGARRRHLLRGPLGTACEHLLWPHGNVCLCACAGDGGGGGGRV